MSAFNFYQSDIIVVWQFNFRLTKKVCIVLILQLLAKMNTEFGVID